MYMLLSKMELNIFGLKTHVDFVAIFIIVLLIMCGNLISGCLKSKEGFFDFFKKETKGCENKKDCDCKKKETTEQNESLFMLSNNYFRPECCASTSISGSTGCACLTKEQTDLLHNRGGNA